MLAESIIVPHQVKLFDEDKICIFIRFDHDGQEQCDSPLRGSKNIDKYYTKNVKTTICPKDFHSLIIVICNYN